LSIELKLTRDPVLLQQYYDLREQCFRKELGLDEFDGSEEYQDQYGQILLAIRNGRCIGGARISPNVLLQSQVRQLQLKREACCMWERFVFEPAERSVQLIRDFLAHLIDVSREIGYQHAMILSSLRNARFYRQCHTALGVDYQIHRQVPHCAQGSFAGLEHYLSVANLQNPRPLKIAPDPKSAANSTLFGRTG
jgi:hypothetical protein